MNDDDSSCKRIAIDIQNASKSEVPADAHLDTWVRLALPQDCQAEIGIRITDKTESAELNQQYRGKANPTNVLSFSYEYAQINTDTKIVGDLVVCAPIVTQEAKAAGIKLEARWAHMIIHGMLHLQGYDHEKDADAAEMEGLEITLLQSLGFDNPYE